MKKEFLGILFLFLFFPYGLFYMWKNKLWEIKTRYFISSFFTLIVFIAFLSEPSKNNSSKSNVNKITDNESNLELKEKEEIDIVKAQKAEEEKQKKSEQERQKKAKEKEEQRAREENCKQDLSCWAEKHISYAGSFCEDHIESRAQYDLKWETGWLENIFSHYKWKNKSSGIVTYIGDKVKFQNGFGAFKKVRYECDFNGNTKEVLSVRVQ